MGTLYALNDKDLRTLREIKRRVLGGDTFRPGAPGGSPAQPRWMPWKNNAATDCPGWGLILPTGISYFTDIDITEQAAYLTGTRPSGTFSRRYAVNSPSTVPAGEWGWCTFDSPVRVAYDTGTPAFGEGWGAKKDQWTAAKNYGACLAVLGLANGDNLTMLAMNEPISAVIGKLSTSLSQGGSGTIDIWYGAGGSEADSTLDLTGRDWLMKSGATSISTGKKVLCQWINGLWYVSEVECP